MKSRTEIRNTMEKITRRYGVGRDGSIQSLREGRKFGITRKGHVGWFPMAAKKDNALCFLEHSDVPFVLCRAKIPGTYTLVGDRYIHGLMNSSRSIIADIESTSILIE